MEGSRLGQAAFETVLEGGDASPKALERLVSVLLLGNRESDDIEKSHGGNGNGGHEKMGSQQLSGDPFESMARGEYVEPRYNPTVWASSIDSNTRLGRSIRTFARNTVGLGWYIEPIHRLTPHLRRWPTANQRRVN